MRYFFILLFLLQSIAPTIAQESDKLTIETLFQKTTYTIVQMSPDGQYISFVKNETELLILPIHQKVESAKVVFSSSNEKILSQNWSPNSQSILFTTEENQHYNLHVVNDIASNQALTSTINSSSYSQPIIHHFSQKESGVFFVSLQQSEDDSETLYKTHIENHWMQSERRFTFDLQNIYFDQEDHIVAFTTKDSKTNYTNLIHIGAAYDTIVANQFLHQSKIIGLNDEKQLIYFTSNAISDNYNKLYQFDYQEQQLEAVTEFSQQEKDIFHVHFKNSEIKGFSYYDGHLKSIWQDSIWQSVQDSISQKFPDANIFIVDSDDEERSFLVKISAFHIIPEYYSYDIENNNLTFIFSENPAIQKHGTDLSTAQTINYSSFDGQAITGIVFLPQVKKVNKLPLVVLLDDAPFESQVVHEFDPKVQYLTQLGFAVFKTNYRGSLGYGKKFTELGFQQLTHGIGRDIQAGIDHLISVKIAHPKKIAVVAHGEMAFGALQKLLTSSTYKAAVHIDGVLDLNEFITSTPPYWQELVDRRSQTLGNQLNKSYSLHSDDIFLSKKPVLFIQNQPNIYNTTKQIQDYIRKSHPKKSKISYSAFPTVDASNSLVQLYAIGQFLSKNLKVKNNFPFAPELKTLAQQREMNISEIRNTQLKTFQADSLPTVKRRYFPWSTTFEIEHSYGDLSHTILADRSYDRLENERYSLQDDNRDYQIEQVYYTEDMRPVYRKSQTPTGQTEWSISGDDLYIHDGVQNTQIKLPKSYLWNSLGLDFILVDLALQPREVFHTYILDEHSQELKACTIEHIGHETIGNFKHNIIQITNYEDPEDYLKIWLNTRTGRVSQTEQVIPAKGYLKIKTKTTD